MVIDHIGVVVKSINESIQHWEKVFGYKQITNIVHNTRQQVKVVFLEKEDSVQIKLIEPFNENSPVFVFARKSGGLHHLCFRVPRLNEELDKLQEKHGLKIITKPQPGEAFENERIAFAYAKHGLNIELIETDKRASRIDQKE